MSVNIDCAFYSNIVYQFPNYDLHTIKDNIHVTNIDISSLCYETSDCDAECIIFKYKPIEALIICYKGSNSVEDWKHNLNIAYRKLNVIGNEIGSPRAHAGFMRQFDSIKNRVQYHIQKYILEKNTDKKTHIIFTGHSSGAALATISSYYFSELSNLVISNINFGSPRVGNKDFVRSYNTKNIFSRSFIHVSDPITRLPSMLRFSHINDITYINNTGETIPKCSIFRCKDFHYHASHRYYNILFNYMI